MYSVILTELGISVFNDGQVDKAFAFSNPVKEYLAIKSKEAKLNELINYLAKIQRGVSVSDESLLAILKKFSIDCHIMDSEELEKTQSTKPQIIVDSGFASNLQDTLGKLREFALGFSSSKVTEVSQSPDLHIIQAINSLDEIDKIGSDHRGDPSSALLEVLDPEQNHSFYDNYLESEYDLSKTLFIATANDISRIQPALRDRLEIIDLSGYAVEEKIEIAKRHLLPKQRQAHGLDKINFKVLDNVLEKVIEDYTRESGVRELDRQLASIMRYQAKELAYKHKVKPTVTKTDLNKIFRRH